MSPWLPRPPEHLVLTPSEDIETAEGAPMAASVEHDHRNERTDKSADQKAEGQCHEDSVTGASAGTPGTPSAGLNDSKGQRTDSGPRPKNWQRSAAIWERRARAAEAILSAMNHPYIREGRNR